MIFIAKDIASSQSKRCLLFVQVGTNGLGVRQLWGRPRESAFIHIEIDTPFERLRIGIGPCRGGLHFRLPVAAPHGAYRDRWLRKLGYEVR